jgi:Prasinovirus endonuclease VII
MKVCSICGIEKDLDCFHPRKDARDGLMGQCKVCVAQKNKAWRARHDYDPNANKKPYVKAFRTPEQIREDEERSQRRRTQRYMKGILASRVNSAIRNDDHDSCANEIMGCTIVELKAHIESLWRPGMSWGNRGAHGWHVDHIVPCVAFDLTDPEQQKQCFHWSNCQPLWAKENIMKGDLIMTDTGPERARKRFLTHS